MSDNDAHFQRAIDKYADKDICTLLPEEKKEFFEAIAARGAYAVLVHIGLDDDAAIENLKSILLSMRSYRRASLIVKTTVWAQLKNFIKLFFKILGYVISITFIGYCLKMIMPAPEADRIISMFTHGG